MSRISDYHELIDFLTLTKRSKAANGDLDAAEVTTYKNVWANVRPLTGFRRLQFEQIHNGKPYSIKIRYNQAREYNEDMIILWRGKRLTIKSLIIDDAAFKEISIEAIEQA